jgi:ATP-binding cassette subfamily B protein
MVNGQDTSKVTKLSLRNKFAFIPQGQFIFHRSLFENIAYGATDLRRKLAKDMGKDLKFKDLDNDFRNRIIEAAKKSGAHDFIISLQDGYDSVYGTDIGLSGGQCQRIMMS